MWYTYESDFNTISDSIEELSELCLENGLKKKQKLKFVVGKKKKSTLNNNQKF